tara:strand:- start:218 stop:685 length:468 start_codon:yes stop_codon:yes gene_type:complete
MAKKLEEINPFLSSLNIDCYYKSSQKGHETEAIRSITYALTDSEPYTSVYQTNLLPVMRVLSGSSPTLVFYILAHLGYESEKIEIKEEKACEACDFSPATFRRAIDQLRTLSIILKSTNRKDTYWVNPMLFFRGSRITVFPHNLNVPALPKSPSL